MNIFKYSVIAILFSFVLFILFDWLNPIPLEHKGYAQVVTSHSGIPLRQFSDKNGVWRYQTSIKKVSPLYIQALLNYEDKYFYQHFGVNPISLVRAMIQWGKSGRIISGGSTITMQAARLAKPSKRNVYGKFLQIIRALQLEWHYNKEEILNYYINHVPFGGPIEGVETASWFYFGYSAENLTLAQSALLAVLPQAPSYYRPDKYPQRAQAARDKVLERLVQYNVVDAEVAEYSRQETVQVELEKPPLIAPLLSRKLTDSNNQPVIQTYIDVELQKNIAEMTKPFVHQLGDRVSAAILVMDNTEGKVIVHIGSADFLDNSRFSHVDMTTALRTPGSTLKPFIYGMALDAGFIHSHSLLQDVPLSFERYVPDNFDESFSGPVSVSQALQRSLNIPAVQVLERLKPLHFYVTMKNAGIQLTLPYAAEPNLSIALGGVAVNLTQLVTLYSSLVNEGKTIQPQFSEGSKSTFTPINILSQESAWIIRQMLLDNPASQYTDLIQKGYAVKTGTGYRHQDIWAIGVSSKYTIGVWLGRPDNVSLTGHQGSSTAVPLLENVVMSLNHSDAPIIAKPRKVQKKTICWPLGIETSHSCLQQHSAWIMDGVIPKTLMTNYNEQGTLDFNTVDFQVALDTGLRVPQGCGLASKTQKIDLWPKSLENWLDKPMRNNSRLPKIDVRCLTLDVMEANTKLSIKGVTDGHVFRRHSISKKLPELELLATGTSDKYYWFINGKLQDIESAPLTLELYVGEYIIVLMDKLGETARIEFSVVK